MARRIRLSSASLLISKPGLDALSSDPHDLLVSASLTNTRAALAGTITATGSGTIPHGLGYIPIFWAYASRPDSGVFLWADTAQLHYSMPLGILSYVISFEQWV